MPPLEQLKLTHGPPPIGLRRCINEEEASCSSPLLPRRLLHLPRLHDPLPRERLQKPYGMPPFRLRDRFKDSRP